MNDYSKIHTNQRLLLQELERRGVKIEILVSELEIAEASYGKHTELLVDRDSSVMPYAATLLASDKYISKKLLQRAKLPVPQGEQFFPDQLGDALRYLKSFKAEFVFKPSVGSHGRLCFTDLNSQQQFEKALEQFVIECGNASAYLLEEQALGSEYRIFITKQGKFAVLHREPAFVVGDGISSIAKLIEQTNLERSAPRKNALCPIQVDNQVHELLAAKSLTLSSIPMSGQKVYLRTNSNLATGGFCEDYTTRTHRGFIALAYRALKVFPQLPYAGVDVMTTDITASPKEVSCKILEVNSNPGLHMHVRPGAGESQNVAAYVADMIFPETIGR